MNKIRILFCVYWDAWHATISLASLLLPHCIKKSLTKFELFLFPPRSFKNLNQISCSNFIRIKIKPKHSAESIVSIVSWGEK